MSLFSCYDFTSLETSAVLAEVALGIGQILSNNFAHACDGIGKRVHEKVGKRGGNARKSR